MVTSFEIGPWKSTQRWVSLSLWYLLCLRSAYPELYLSSGILVIGTIEFFGATEVVVDV